jgi:hypothetical protein
MENENGTDDIEAEKEVATIDVGKKRKVNDSTATCEKRSFACATAQAVYPIFLMQPISMYVLPQLGLNEENEPRIHVGDYADRESNLEERLRHEKRKRYVAAIMKTPGFKAYCASMDRGEARALRVPATPDASDSSLSKRQWEEVCRRWRTGLKQFGELPLSLRRSVA